MLSHDYIINAGKSQNNCVPVNAALTKEEAIEKAKVLIEQHTYEYTEVVLMPESDINIILSIVFISLFELIFVSALFL